MLRITSRSARLAPSAEIFPSDNQLLRHDDEPELSAFRGLLVAFSLSVLFWGACLTAVWLLRSRS
jgi:hypothetical protein